MLLLLPDVDNDSDDNHDDDDDDDDNVDEVSSRPVSESACLVYQLCLVVSKHTRYALSRLNSSRLVHVAYA